MWIKRQNMFYYMITTPSASDTNKNKNAGHASNVCSSQPVNKWRPEHLPVCTYLNTITKGCVPSVDTAPWLKTFDCSVWIGVSVPASPATGCTIDYQIYVYQLFQGYTTVLDIPITQVSFHHIKDQSMVATGSCIWFGHISIESEMVLQDH